MNLEWMTCQNVASEFIILNSELNLAVSFSVVGQEFFQSGIGKRVFE